MTLLVLLGGADGARRSLSRGTRLNGSEILGAAGQNESFEPLLVLTQSAAIGPKGCCTRDRFNPLSPR